MTMASYKYGKPIMARGTPASNINAGDVIVQGGYPMVAHAANPVTTVGLTAPTVDALAVAGGIYTIPADNAYPVGTFVYWNAATNQVGVTGSVPFGPIVGGPAGQFSDGGPTGAASLCDVLHAPYGATSESYNVGAQANDNITNTASETLFATTATIPLGTLQVGDVVSVRTAAVVTAQNSTNTNLFKLKCNNTNTIINTGALNLVANGLFYADVDLIFTAIGNTGAFTTVGIFSGANSGGAVDTVYLGSTTINTNANITLGVTDTQSAASTGNNATLLELNASLKRK